MAFFNSSSLFHCVENNGASCMPILLISISSFTVKTEPDSTGSFDIRSGKEGRRRICHWHVLRRHVLYLAPVLKHARKKKFA